MNAMIGNSLLLGGEGYQISRSVRLRASANAYLQRTNATTGTDPLKFTVSGWIKRGLSTASYFPLIGSATGSAAFDFIGFQGDNFVLRVRTSASSDVVRIESTAVYRDFSAWYHLVAIYDSANATSTERVKLYVNGVQITSFGTATYPPLNQGLTGDFLTDMQIGRTNTNASNQNYGDGYLTEMNFIDGQALDPSYFGETDAITGVWKPKKYAGTYGTNGWYLNFSDNSSLPALGYSYAGGTHVNVVESDGSIATITAGNGAFKSSTISTANASGPSAVNEYLVITPYDALPVSSSLKIYLDVTSYSWATGRNLYINGTQVASGNVTIAAVSGMYEWTINISGHGITSLSSVTLPQATTGRCFIYGISIDGSAVVATANDWTPTNISLTAGVTYDSMIDVPTQWADGGNGRGNYATLNPLQKVSGYAPDNGNLRSVMNATGAIFASIGVTTGKWYWENIYEVAPNGNLEYGVSLGTVSTLSQPGNVSGSWAYSPFNGSIYSQSGTAIATVASASLNDVIGLALDVDAGTLAIYKNNALLYTISSISGGALFPVIGGSSSINAQTSVNFGQRPFAYTPPTGFKALNTLNLPTPTILKGNQYFDANIYSGQNTSLSITNSGAMQPDLVWIKKRSAVADHNLTDAVRGTNRNLISNSTAVEDTVARLTSFNSNGFTLAGNFDNTNISGSTYVGWQWKEGATQGFDIVTYTGTGVARTVAHSLGVAPSMMIVKQRDTGGGSWFTYHISLGAGQILTLQTTSAAAASTTAWNNTAPTSSVFSLGASTGTNNSSSLYVAYLFAEVAGFSKFGSYTGNGSTDGPFVYCGFRPRFVMVKRTDSVGSWWMLDSTRDPYNLATKLQRANENLAEETSYASIDILSNGFKLRVSVAESNASGGTYIFAAFCESPFKNSLAR